MSIGEMIPPDSPFQFEGLDLRPSFRASSDGSHIYSINVMVTEQVWNALKTIPRHRIIGGVLYWHDGDEPESDDAPLDLKIKKPRKADQPKGEWGKYWAILVGKNAIFKHPDLLQVLSDRHPHQPDPEQALRDEFQVSSRTFISPERFESWLASYGLDGLVSLSRQAVAKIGG